MMFQAAIKIISVISHIYLLPRFHQYQAIGSEVSCKRIGPPETQWDLCGFNQGPTGNDSVLPLSHIGP